MLNRKYFLFLVLIILSLLAAVRYPGADAVPTCQLCQSNLPTSKIECIRGHAFCKECIQKCAQDEMDNHESILTAKLPCPVNECEYWIPEHRVRRALPIHDKFGRFMQVQKQKMAVKKYDCQCCFAYSAVVACPNGHGLCATCLEMESEQQLAGNREAVTSTQTFMKCPAAGCRLKLPEPTVKKGMPGSIYSKRRHAVKQRLNAELNNRCKVCGKKGDVIRDIGPNLLCDMIQCNDKRCGARCCAECSEPVHTNHQCTDESKYENWLRLLDNSTPCPTCRTFIQKTEGCHHMHCKCGTDFCYACGASYWSHRCNSYLINYRDRHSHFLAPIRQRPLRALTAGLVCAGACAVIWGCRLLLSRQ